jgi:peroxiredoxin
MVGLSLGLFLSLISVNRALAADEEDAEQSKAAASDDEAANDEESDGDQAEEEGSAEEPDPLAVPEGGAKEMMTFAMKLSQARPEGDTDLERARWLGRANRAIADAAARGLESDPSDQEAQMLTFMRLQALQRVEQAAKQERELAAAEAREDERAGVAAAGWQMFVREAASAWDEKKDDQKEQFRRMLLDDFPAEADKAAARASAIRMAAMFLERKDADYAKQLIKDAVEKLEGGDDEKLADVSEQLAGMLRRMDLMGNTMELKGPLLDGEELDWESYRGNVVLVDYWATWCGPCVAELPNVKEMYDAYHDKGFDVLGISLDTSKEKVEEFVEERELAWKTMFAADEEDQGWNHPMARYYGISAIPTAILVDREGRVVHMNARGPALKEKLQELLGDPAPPAENADEEDKEDAEGSPDAEADEAAG